MILALGFIFGGYRKVSPFFLTKHMRKFITCIVSTIALFSVFTCGVKANSTEAGASAVLKNSQTKKSEFDYRIYVLKKFLAKNNSPLTPYSIDFIEKADMYQIDYRMVPAITGVESTFGRQIPVNSYNAYGWANGKYAFKSWPDSIEIVTKTLKYKYVDKGAVTVAKIARIYAPPSTTWSYKVQNFITKINPLPLTFDI